MQNVCRRYGDPRPGSGPPGLYGLPVIHVATTSGRWGDDRAPQSRLPTGRTVQLTYQNRPGQTLAAAALVWWSRRADRLGGWPVGSSRRCARTGVQRHTFGDPTFALSLMGTGLCIDSLNVWPL